MCIVSMHRYRRDALADAIKNKQTRSSFSLGPFRAPRDDLQAFFHRPLCRPLFGAVRHAPCTYLSNQRFIDWLSAFVHLGERRRPALQCAKVSDDCGKFAKRGAWQVSSKSIPSEHDRLVHCQGEQRLMKTKHGTKSIYQGHNTSKSSHPSAMKSRCIALTCFAMVGSCQCYVRRLD